MKQETEKQRQAWNKFSRGWQKWDTFVLGILKPIGDRMLEAAELRNTDRVLDVSTGTGEPGLTAAHTVAQVVATDVSEGMVEVARQNAMSRGLNNLKHRLPMPKIYRLTTTVSMRFSAG